MKPKEGSPAIHPVTLEVIRNALPAIPNEMSHDLQRTSYNMMIYEVRDYCTALLGPDGALIAQDVGGVSHFVADLGVIIKDGVARYGADGFSPGDVLMHNHQGVAGQHLNNVVIYTPIFFEEELVAFSVVRAHWVDIGGLSTGFSGAGAIDPWSEGLQIDQLKIYEKGAPDEKVMRLIHDNIRYPDAGMGDLRSQLAACRLAERRYQELLGRYGKDVVQNAIRALYAETEARCRTAVEAIPDGVYEAESLFDGRSPEPYTIKAKVTVSGGDMEIDLSGCSQQRPKEPINSRTYAAAYIAYKALTTPLEPVNEGAFAALKVVIPEGNMMMAQFPAFMANWSAALPTVVDTILRALADALPDRIPAAHSGSLGAAMFYGGEPYEGYAGGVAQSIEAGGWGGRPNADGEDVSMSVCQGDVRNAPIETMELKSPILIVERALRQDSGGEGRFRGGLGVSTWAKGFAPGNWYVGGGALGRVSSPPWGLWGGRDGAIARIEVKGPADAEFRPSGGAPRYSGQAGAEVHYRTAGGGGWGDPLERDPQAVRRDVEEGYVSRQRAHEVYGVVLSDGDEIDAAATERRRAELKGRR
ncbi:MAG TPA: hydantoinase B/oxoprolinase family protein [Beijerinckiaceae bacterium]|nr:hydantoinase B/oxoprolinase family protein [Beijerinckiaceae bacterium]